MVTVPKGAKEAGVRGSGLSVRCGVGIAKAMTMVGKTMGSKK